MQPDPDPNPNPNPQAGRQPPEARQVLTYERTPPRVPVATFSYAGEACMAAGKLESEGVECVVVEHAILEGISARGASVVVQAEHLARAAEILFSDPGPAVFARDARRAGGRARAR